MEKKGKCILVCAGDLEISEIPVKEEDIVIAVDGGYLYCQVFGIEPDIVIGDFDSLEERYVAEIERKYAQAVSEGMKATEEKCTQAVSEGMKAAKKECAESVSETRKKRMIRLSSVKDDTDTLAALRFGLAEGYREFHLYGALGGRLEHTLANLQCLLFLKDMGASGYIWDGASMTTLIRNEALSFRKEMEGMLSVFAFDGAAEGVYETGLKYTLNDAVIHENFPIGVSNEFIGEKAEIRVTNGALLVIVRWE